MNIAIKKLKKILHEIRFRMKLKKMDDIWEFMGGNCFGMFPPSFYYTHTEEEIDHIATEKMEEIQKIIEQLRKTKKGSSDFLK